MRKVLEKMINNRLIQYLEAKKTITNIQCGFRKHRSTIGQLIRLDTYIKQGVVVNKATVEVFVDLENAYDSTWRYGIIRDMQQLDLRGRLPKYIAEFMREIKFKVAVNWAESTEKNQEGVPQGSILSVTLLAIKINSLSSIIPSTI